MPYNAEPGEVAYVVASKQTTHGDVAAEQGFCGKAVKTQTPAADTPRANRAVIASGESFLLLIDGVTDAPAGGALAGVAKGDMVWIDPTDNSLATATATGLLVLGRVWALPGERGTPSDRVKINLEQKV